MTYPIAFIEAAGGDHLTPLELRGHGDLAVAGTLYAGKATLGDWCRSRGIRFGRDLHMTDDAAMFTRTAGVARPGMHPLHEGKTFHQYTDTWDTPPRYAVSTEALSAKPSIQAASAGFRLAFRDIAHATNERTMIASMMPPGVVFGHTATVERAPAQRPDAVALTLCGVLNSYTFDWLARLKAGVHLSLYLIDGLPMPDFCAEAASFLADGALRLCASHKGYAALWLQQTGRTWSPDLALRSPAGRWRLRAAMDAAVARAYELDRAGYERVLAGFSHRSFPDAPLWCLAAFDASAKKDPGKYFAAGLKPVRQAACG